ncbi:ABC transporter ATP-binding protein [Balneatrix alpica]|uniref:ABC transporter ATP-binding protein n=1 Tax=Balneatrix alpica TaxID=75684 RepID=A0ABV5ZEZ7_9GAMM|nr:ATP-binding cassette domain-containing protein [Balneatrix alpica]
MTTLPSTDVQPLLLADHIGKVVQTQSGPLTLLADVSLRVEAAQTLAILGRSGAGKSTLLGLLAGLDVPSEGAVCLDGNNLAVLSEEQRAALRARYLGFVFQSFQLLADLTALENVSLPLALCGHPQAEQEARYWLQQVGLGQRLNHTPRQLSGGEQQRVALARAFAGRPRVLFADEPTGNLDEQTGAQIMELLFNLNQELGTTLILVTHDVELAARCQRRIYLEAGQIQQEVQHEG